MNDDEHPDGFEPVATVAGQRSLESFEQFQQQKWLRTRRQRSGGQVKKSCQVSKLNIILDMKLVKSGNESDDWSIM